MYLDDKILKIVEVKKVGVIKKPNFYFCLMPKVLENAATLAYVSGKCVNNDVDVDIPVSIGCWNPIVLKSLNVTTELLSNYRVFVGEE